MIATIENFSELESHLAYTFTQPTLLQRALTHRSAVEIHQERMEHLGDAALGLVITEFLYAAYPDSHEGELSRLRAAVVCRSALFEVALGWQLGHYLHVGSGERDIEGKIKSTSIIANSVEAVIGAIFEDGGWAAAREVVLKHWQPLLEHINLDDVHDAKSRLQELTQAKGWGLPEYRIVDRGVTVTQRFEARCYVSDRQQGKGEGQRKKQAETMAAEKAWGVLYVR
ncbi:MAG: ribonuclease III [Mariprofundaceae bacterium]